MIETIIFFCVFTLLRLNVFFQVQIRYISRVDSKHQCTVWVGSFKGDKEFFKEPITLGVEGKDATLTLMNNSEVRACCNSDVRPFFLFFYLF